MMSVAGADLRFDSASVRSPWDTFLGLGRLDRPHTPFHGTHRRLAGGRFELLPCVSRLVRSSVASLTRSLSRVTTVPRVTKPVLAASCTTLSFGLHTFRSGSVLRHWLSFGRQLSPTRATRHGRTRSSVPTRLRTTNNGTGYPLGGLSSPKLVTEVVDRFNSDSDTQSTTMTHKSSCEKCGDQHPRDELIKYIPGGYRCDDCTPWYVKHE